MLALILQHYYKLNFLSNWGGQVTKRRAAIQPSLLFPIHILYLVFQTIFIPLEELLYTILDLYLVSPAETVELIY